MKVKEILDTTRGQLIKGNLEDEIGDFCRDTRIIKKGDTYIGIKGENFDGNKLWNEALKNGASTVLIQGIDFTVEDLDEFSDRNIILVEDTIKALAQIATYKRNLYGKDFPVIGVTGSVGKTSTKDIITNVISQKYKTLKTQGNMNNDIGLPLTILNLTDHEAAVIEMGMNHLGEINKLTRIASPSISVITNIGTAHIGNLGSRENILKAKLEILEGMDKKILVINNDNDLLHNFYLNNKDVEIHTYGIENKSEVMAKDIIINKNSCEFICNYKGKDYKFKVPVGGIHFVYNSLCAITVGILTGLDIEQIQKGIETFELTKKRMDITDLENGVTIINDTYNASLESMKASLEYLNELKCDRKIAVLGDILEVGEFAQDIHRKVGKEVVKNDIDILICSGINSRYIVEEAQKNGMSNDNVFYFEDKIDLENFIKENWQEGDCILFKASNGMRFFDIVDSLLEN